MASDRIRLRLEGSHQDEGFVLADEFIASVEHALEAMRGLQRAIGKGAALPPVRISGLEIGSAVVELEVDNSGFPGIAKGVLSREFSVAVRALKEGKLETRGYDDKTIAAFYGMVRPLRGHVRRLEIGVGNKTEIVDRTIPSFEPRKQKVEQLRKGSFSGFVDAVNVHSDAIFYLYPPTGPTRIPCSFERHTLLDGVRQALERNTRVEGQLEFAEGSPFPIKLYAEKLEVSPTLDQLPTLRELWGTAKGLTGGNGSVEFVRALRDTDE